MYIESKPAKQSQLQKRLLQYLQEMFFQQTALHGAKASVYLHDATRQGLGSYLDLDDAAEHLDPKGVGFYLAPTLHQIATAAVALDKHAILGGLLTSFLHIHW